MFDYGLTKFGQKHRFIRAPFCNSCQFCPNLPRSLANFKIWEGDRESLIYKYLIADLKFKVIPIIEDAWHSLTCIPKH